MSEKTKKYLVLLVLLLSLAAWRAYSHFNRPPIVRIQDMKPSSFVAQFSLDKIIANVNSAYLDCTKGNSGNLSNSRADIPTPYKTYAQFRSCVITDSGNFKDIEFMQSVKAEINKQLLSTGMRILEESKMSQNSEGKNEIQIWYETQDIQSELKIIESVDDFEFGQPFLKLRISVREVCLNCSSGE